MSPSIVLSSLKFALVGKMWGKFEGIVIEFWKRKSAVSYCLTAPCFSENQRRGLA